MIFKIVGYVIDAVDNKLKISINQDYQEKFKNVLNKLYKNNNKDYTEITVSIKKAIVNMDRFSYSEIYDLIGIEISLICYSQYYCFCTNQEKKEYVKGFTFHASKIQNIL